MRRLKLSFSLLCVLLITAGCFSRYSVSNAIKTELSVKPEGKILPVSIDNAGMIDEVERLEYRDEIASLLIKDGYRFIYYDESDKRLFSHSINITITEKPFGGAGFSLFTGLSLGIIPSVEFRESLIAVEVTLLKDEEEIDRVFFTADFKMYGGLIFIPLSFLNQKDIDVISDEIHKAVNLLIINNNVAVAIVGEKQAQFLSPPQTDEKIAKQTEQFIQQIYSTSLEDRIIAAKKIVRRGRVTDPGMYNKINAYLLENYKKTGEKDHSNDEIAWLCKALSTSGLPIYKKTLYEVYKSSNNFILRGHVRDSLNFVDEYAAGGKGFNQRWQL